MTRGWQTGRTLAACTGLVLVAGCSSTENIPTTAEPTVAVTTTADPSGAVSTAPEVDVSTVPEDDVNAEVSDGASPQPTDAGTVGIEYTNEATRVTTPDGNVTVNFPTGWFDSGRAKANMQFHWMIADATQAIGVATLPAELPVDNPAEFLDAAKGSPHLADLNLELGAPVEIDGEAAFSIDVQGDGYLARLIYFTHNDRAYEVTVSGSTPEGIDAATDVVTKITLHAAP